MARSELITPARQLAEGSIDTGSFVESMQAQGVPITPDITRILHQYEHDGVIKFSSLVRAVDSAKRPSPSPLPDLVPSLSSPSHPSVPSSPLAHSTTPRKLASELEEASRKPMSPRVRDVPAGAQPPQRLSVSARLRPDAQSSEHDIISWRTPTSPPPPPSKFTQANVKSKVGSNAPMGLAQTYKRATHSSGNIITWSDTPTRPALATSVA
mmetsp:Transcript_26866/g.43863  ORF Transcript_26866/g.43863 Transcript_26866/m.43863 type:complete len:211 (-) Transcript_26866:926-1558(-)